jgi:hypothetical protein
MFFLLQIRGLSWFLGLRDVLVCPKRRSKTKPSHFARHLDLSCLIIESERLRTDGLCMVLPSRKNALHSFIVTMCGSQVQVEVSQPCCLCVSLGATGSSQPSCLNRRKLNEPLSTLRFQI